MAGVWGTMAPSRARMLAAVLLALCAAALGVAPAAQALDGPHSFRNANIADRAELRANGTHVGECLVFATIMIDEAGGPRYYFGFNTGTYQHQWSQRATSVGSLAAARRGDIIQWGGGAGGNMLHTAIITSPGPNPGIIDSNWGYNKSVGRGTFSSRNRPGSFYRIWRVGRDDSIITPPPDVGKPVGNVDILAGAARDSVVVQGWTIDPDDRPASTDVHVYIDGPAGSPNARGVSLGAADISRPDVARVHQGAGDRHGFSAAIPNVSPGPHAVYVYAINRAGGGSNPLIGSATINVPATRGGSPFGSYDEVVERVGYKARVRGWTIDPDAPRSPTDVHAYIDGPAGSGARGISLGQADASRPDVDAAHRAGPAHGIDKIVNGLPPGAHTVWLYAINKAGGGENPLLGVKRVWVSGPSPVGNVELIQGAMPGKVAVKGWTLDPDAISSATDVHVYVDGPPGAPGARGFSIGSANILRPDVADVFPGAGPAHGFAAAVGDFAPGNHPVWVYAINRAGAGDNPLLGTTTVNIPAAPPGTPFGAFDAANGGEALASIRGWTIDPDARTLPTDVHAYVDGPAGSGARGIALGTAAGSRPDVGRAFPGSGDNHGFEKVVDKLAPGNHSIWVYGINRAGGGENPLLRTLPVTVRAARPPAASPAPSLPTGRGPSGPSADVSERCRAARAVKTKARKRVAKAKRAWQKRPSARTRRAYKRAKRSYSSASRRAASRCTAVPRG